MPLPWLPRKKEAYGLRKPAESLLSSAEVARLRAFYVELHPQASVMEILVHLTNQLEQKKSKLLLITPRLASLRATGRYLLALVSGVAAKVRYQRRQIVQQRVVEIEARYRSTVLLLRMETRSNTLDTKPVSRRNVQ